MSKLVKKSDKEKSVRDLLSSPAMQAQLRMALPKHVSAERLARTVMTQIRLNPKLLDCTRESLLGSIMQCAQLGLEPGVLGQAWVIPYGREATFVVGYRGLCQLGYRSKQITSISARAVFEGDAFSYDFGEDKLSHVPHGETDPKKLTHAYAVIHTGNGGRLFDVMLRVEIERIRSRSRAGKTGPWATDYAEMAKKTVLRRLFKIAPCSAEIQSAMVLDDQADAGMSQGLDFEIPEAAEPPPERDVTPPKPEAKPDPEVDPETGEVVPTQQELDEAR